MPEKPAKSSRPLARRSILSLAVLSTTALVGCSSRKSEDPALSSPSPAASPPPEAPVLQPKDPRLTQALQRVSPTKGVKASWAGAFPAIKVKTVVALHGLGQVSTPWLAVTIVGTTNQLQIVDPSTQKLIQSLNFAKSHNGGMESMVWDERNALLYIVTSNYLYFWDPKSPDATRLLGEVPEASTLYDVQLDSQGNLWGGTYPSGTVFRYSPSNQSMTAFSRFAADTDYVRRLAIDDRDRIWAGTGSLNPRIFTFTTNDPETRAEIQLPEPMENGFISRLTTHGDYLMVSASDISGQLRLNLNSRSWERKIERVWSARRTSQPTLGASVFYSMSDGELYSTNPNSLVDTKLGALSADSPLALIASASQVLVVSAADQGLRLEIFDTKQRKVVRELAIALAAGKFTVQSLLGHSNGNVYVGGYMGSGLAAINPDTGTRWSSPEAQNVMNQIEGMIEFDDRRLYIGSYGSADIVSVDFRQRDQPNAYDRLVRLSTEYAQSRPFGWAKNSRNVFFGTVPDYGRAGGVLGMIDPSSDTVKWVLDGGGKGFIEAQSIIGLAANDEFVYGVSSVRNGYGVPDTQGLAQVFKLNLSTRKIVWQTAPVKNAGALYAPVLIADWLVVADIEGIAVIDTQTGKLAKKHRLTEVDNEQRRPGWANAAIARIGEGTQLVHSAHGTASIVDFVQGTMANIGDPADEVSFGSRLAVGPTGRVFGSMNQTTVVEFDLTPATAASTSKGPSIS